MDGGIKKEISYIEAHLKEHIEKQLARKMGAENFRISAPANFSKKEIQKAIELYDKCCPGIKEELEGFAEEGNMKIEEMAYTWMTYLLPRCSGIVLLGSKCTDGHTKLVRNYEFSTQDEDLTLCKTAVAGEYAHIGETVIGFGRNEALKLAKKMPIAFNHF